MRELVRTFPESTPQESDVVCRLGPGGAPGRPPAGRRLGERPHLLQGQGWGEGWMIETVAASAVLGGFQVCTPPPPTPSPCAPELSSALGPAAA